MEDTANRVNDKRSYILAFDTANEVVAIGIGKTMADMSVDALKCASVELIATREVAAHRASNTVLLSEVDVVLTDARVDKSNIAAVVCGRGPGSFTGVRICMATAKGVASALEVPLFGVSTLDAVAWNAWAEGIRGRVLVAADAMRKEVYPVLFELSDSGAVRLSCDTVIKATATEEWLSNALMTLNAAQTPGNQAHGTSDFERGENSAIALDESKGNMEAEQVEQTAQALEVAANAESSPLFIIGDALVKYGDDFAKLGTLGSRSLWSVTGRGLLLAARVGDGNPATLLPVYTRLSDAEENERARLSEPNPKNLRTGVQHESDGAEAFDYRPLDSTHVQDVAALEAQTMGSDAWSVSLVADELPRKNRTWWAAYDGDRLVGYCGGLVVDGQVQILKVATDPDYRRRGIARELMGLVAADARNLGASEMTLEVRRSNTDGQAFYKRLGLDVIGVRPHYYSDREDAIIMTGPLSVTQRDVAGMRLHIDNVSLYPAEPSNGAYANVGRKDSISAKTFGDARDIANTSDIGAFNNTAGTNGACDASDTDDVMSTNDISEPLPKPMSGKPNFGTYPQIVHPLILAIESSCDETAASVIDGDGRILSDVVASQIDFHSRFGGVVPEIASRKHIEAICGVCDECLDAASHSIASYGSVRPVASGHLDEPDTFRLHWSDLDAVAVTYAPGLVGALVVGVAFAKGAAWGANKPLIAVNHLEGHLYANRIARPDIQPPMVVSLVSGGHTMLVYVRDWGDYETLGSTIDDAVGEAFDKVAKALGLGYPGGPAISKLAAKGNPKAIEFPRALMHSGDLRFSLSGLKTAVITYIQKEQAAGRELNMPDIAASFTAAVVDVQVAKAKTALIETGAKEFCLGGGVAANSDLRSAYERMCKQIGVRLTMPPLSACGDQAAMIAEVARDRYEQGKFADLSLDVKAHAPLDEPY